MKKIIKNQNIKDGSVFSDYVVQPAHFKDIEPEVKRGKWDLVIPSRIVTILLIIYYILATMLNTKHSPIK